MNKLFLAIAGFIFSASVAYAQTPASPSAGKAAAPTASSCQAKAVDKNGKPLAGAAKTSFMKKCEAGDGKTSSCAAQAVDKNGKPLAGAAKASFIKKCEAGSGK
jgi:hypothetical protein